MKTLFLFLIGYFALTEAVADNGINAKVIRIIDGNTLEVSSKDKETYKIVLAGIDSPELTQEYGDKAMRLLEKLLEKEDVVVFFQGKDRKGNYIGVVLVNGKRDPRIELLKEGLAWTAEKNPLPELETHKNEAQEKGKGLWKDDNPTPPWIYRRQQSMMQPKSS
jgi:endonuclease YncB( thermonuclease family)